MRAHWPVGLFSLAILSIEVCAFGRSHPSAIDFLPLEVKKPIQFEQLPQVSERTRPHVNKPLGGDSRPSVAAQLRRASRKLDFDLWDERLLLDIIPIVLGQRGCNENGTLSKFSDFLLRDETNDEIMLSSPEEIIERSGFSYERHESLSDDGYSTKLIRLRNPKMVAEGRQLKQPPVMLLQPGPISRSAFIWASSGQHWPQAPASEHHSEPHHSPADQLDEPKLAAIAASNSAIGLPPLLDSLVANHQDGSDPERRPEVESADNGRRSSNRSLAFMLANHGYDVWLVETRGGRGGGRAMQQNGLASSLSKTSKSIGSLLAGANRNKNMTLGENLVQLTRAPSYWSYSFDEPVRHELKNQINKVLEVSRAQNVSLVSYSFSSLVSLPFLASRPRFARKRVHNLVLMAPIMSNRGANTLSNYLYQVPCLRLPDHLIGFFGTGAVFTKPLRRLFVKLGLSSPAIRYKVLKFLLYLMQGPSPKYRTFLEPAVFGHLFEPTSLLQVKHFCQQVLARRYQRYDFGPLNNLLVYGREEPPAYDLGQLNVADWMLIAANNDNLGTRDSVERLLEEVGPRPSRHLQLAGYAHLDLVAAVDNDVRVNLPILDYLEQNRYYLD